MEIIITIICDLIGLKIIYNIITNPIKTELKEIKQILEKLINEQNSQKRKERLEKLEKLGEQNRNKPE